MSGHHPDCPALHYTDKPERCRCALLAMLDRRAEHPCSTPGCPGDGRYAAPGRGHADGCTYPRVPSTSEGE